SNPLWQDAQNGFYEWPTATTSPPREPTNPYSYSNKDTCADLLECVMSQADPRDTDDSGG
ncbi:17637_t:CDS:1, partial [Acaulospora colombiana]